MDATTEATSSSIPLTPEQQRIKQKTQSPTNLDPEKYSYKVTAINRLSRYINHSVIVKRSDNKKQISGELVLVETDTFSVKSNQYGGSAIYSVAMADIVELKVYR